MELKYWILLAVAIAIVVNFSKIQTTVPKVPKGSANSFLAHWKPILGYGGTILFFVLWEFFDLSRTVTHILGVLIAGYGIKVLFDSSPLSWKTIVLFGIALTVIATPPVWQWGGWKIDQITTAMEEDRIETQQEQVVAEAMAALNERKKIILRPDGVRVIKDGMLVVDFHQIPANLPYQVEFAGSASADFELPGGHCFGTPEGVLKQEPIPGGSLVKITNLKPETVMTRITLRKESLTTCLGRVVKTTPS